MLVLDAGFVVQAANPAAEQLLGRPAEEMTGRHICDVLVGCPHGASCTYATCPVRIGVPNGIFGLVDTISGPAFATSVGLLKWGLKQEDLGGNHHHASRPLSGVMDSVMSWLKSFLP